jgi:uncharacterized protein YceH (UPF0502 family)
MALIKNNFGTVDLQATVADLDKRVTALEGSGSSESALAARLAALEGELAALRNALEPTGLPPKES